MPFDPSKHESKTFDLLPAGEYLAIIEGAELRDTKKGDGQFLAVTFQIVSEPGKGRRLWDNLNLDNKNETAVAIAEASLGDICRAVDVDALQDWPGFSAKNPGCICYDLSPLANKPLVIKVKKVYSDFRGEDVNEIAGYRKSAAPSVPGFGPAVEKKTDDDLPF